jgi:hypothetical protein
MDQGQMIGSGTTELNGGGVIFDAEIYRTVNNVAGGGVIVGGTITGNSNTVWNNRNDSIFKISGDFHLLGEGTFNNLDLAFFKKTGGDGTSIVEWDVHHEGNMILVQAGEMSLRGRSYVNGQMMVQSGATLDFQGEAIFGPNAFHADIGTFRISGGTALFDFAFDSDLHTILEGGAEMSGVGTVNFNQHLDWRQSASMVGAGQSNFNATATLSDVDLARTVNNFGETDMNGTLTGNNANWVNKSGSTLRFSGNAQLSGTGTLTNENGAVVRRTSGGVTSINFDFSNEGDVEVEDLSQILFAGSYSQSSAGRLFVNEGATVDFAGPASLDGMIKGGGMVIGSPITAIGRIAPGDSIGSLEFFGGLTMMEDTILEYEIGDISDLIAVIGGPLVLDGTLNVTAMSGFGEGIYTIMTYNNSLQDLGLQLGSMPGGFSGVIVHDGANGSVKLEVTQVPEPASGGLLMLGTMALLLHRRRYRSKPRGCEG